MTNVEPSRAESTAAIARHFERTACRMGWRQRRYLWQKATLHLPLTGVKGVWQAIREQLRKLPVSHPAGDASDSPVHCSRDKLPLRWRRAGGWEQQARTCSRGGRQRCQWVCHQLAAEGFAPEVGDDCCREAEKQQPTPASPSVASKHAQCSAATSSSTAWHGTRPHLSCSTCNAGTVRSVLPRLDLRASDSLVLHRVAQGHFCSARRDCWSIAVQLLNLSIDVPPPRIAIDAAAATSELGNMSPAKD